jgi:hypothetical protein
MLAASKPAKAGPLADSSSYVLDCSSQQQAAHVRWRYGSFISGRRNLPY